MKISNFTFGIAVLSLCAVNASATIHYVDATGTNPAAPYTDWSTAATNIQDAIDASVDGDQVLVTNGVYRFGGKVMAGDLTNRVALDKAVTVQSVNGPWVTTIFGSGTPVGVSGVRCAWLTNGATLVGFTLQGGATRLGGTISVYAGGGVWCASSNAAVANCIIRSNAAYANGGGAYQGALNNCLISSNTTVVTGVAGGGACNVALKNCTIISNANFGVIQTAPNGVTATNCIIFFNQSGNYSSGIFSYCCTTPAIAGVGNFSSAPQFFIDGVHLADTSPCVGAGTNLVIGTDIFGKTWLNPPSVGCAEWATEPLAGPPQIKLTADPIGFTVTAMSSGQPPLGFSWLKNGVLVQNDGHFTGAQTTNLIATGVNFSDAVAYQLVVSNASGIVTSAPAQLMIHCVDVAGTNPTAPYSTWETAATNIQDAINVAASGEVVLVTNGLYATGGKSMDGIITNRVAVDKSILVQSVNGSGVTFIQGAWNPVSTNGNQAVRCVWMTNRSVLCGFTLQRGATQSGGSGGGVLGLFTNSYQSPSPLVFNCVITGNAAAGNGGGARYVSLVNCIISSNVSFTSGGGADWSALRNCLVTANEAKSYSFGGGGAHNCNLLNCAVTLNVASQAGGGASACSLVNCTVTGNKIPALNSGGGVANSMLTNCIVWGNAFPLAGVNSNYVNSTFSYSCTTPPAPGMGNLAFDPLLLADGVHLSAGSPCIGSGAGTNLFVDIDGQPWNTSASMGCDEWQPSPVIAVQPDSAVGLPARGLTFTVVPAGQPPFSCFWRKDGVFIQNGTHYTNASSTRLIVEHLNLEDAGDYSVIVSNSFGAVTSAISRVILHGVSALSSNPVPPYSTWFTAATNIQDAIDFASAKDIVLVSNGVYAHGGRAMAWNLTNRVTLNKALTVISVNGPTETTIQGAWDPVTTNGPAAVRCAWLASGATLNGFTLRNGATREFSGTVIRGSERESGGGVWSSYSDAVVANCVLTNNQAINGGGVANATVKNSLIVFNAASYGGGAYHATLNNCVVRFNFATSSPFGGGGTYSGAVRNSIVLENFSGYPFGMAENNFELGFTDYSYSCSRAYLGGSLPGIGNINGNNTNPQFLDLFHIAATSPLRGAASSGFADGFDLDGEAWANPPSMGCDEVIDANLTGPLSVELQSQVLSGTSLTNLLPKKPVFFYGLISGRASRVEWSFGDGPVVTNLGANASHVWTNVGDFTVTFTAFNNDHPNGVSTNLAVHIVPLNTPQIGSLGLATNGFQFQFSGQSGADYTIQYATNLAPPITWQTLQTIYSSTGGVHQVTDPATTDHSRFYRVLAQ